MGVMGFVWTVIVGLIIGAIAGILCQEAVNLIRNKMHIDDTLDVFAVHGVGGIFGTIMVAALSPRPRLKRRGRSTRSSGRSTLPTTRSKVW